MDEITLREDPNAAPAKRQPNLLAATVTALCSGVRNGLSPQRDHAKGKDAPESPTLPHTADASVASEIGDPDLDRFASAVLDRLVRTKESEVLADPHAALLMIAAEVAAQWPRRAPRANPGCETLIEHSIAALEPRCRAILLSHVNDGLTYRQIARRFGTSPEAALTQLRTAYSQLRFSLAPSTITASELSAEENPSAKA